MGPNRAGVVVLVGVAGPEGVRVELEVLLIDPAKQHGAEPAVADGQRLGPFRGGLSIPEARSLLVSATHGLFRRWVRSGSSRAPSFHGLPGEPIRASNVNTPVRYCPVNETACGTHCVRVWPPDLIGWFLPSGAQWG